MTESRRVRAPALRVHSSTFVAGCVPPAVAGHENQCFRLLSVEQQLSTFELERIIRRRLSLNSILS